MRRRLGMALLLAAAACGAPRPVFVAPPPPLDVAPGARLRGASLFGTDVIGLPDGSALTPDAAPGSSFLALDPHLASLPWFRAGNAVASALSPDGKTLLVLTSGYNRTFDPNRNFAEPGSREYVFAYDVSGGAPREKQVLAVPNAFGGIAFAPNGKRFYVSGGSDDLVRVFAIDAAGFAKEDGAPIALGHLDARGYGGIGLQIGPFAAGLAVTASGAKVVVANHENDSVSVLDVASGSVVAEIKLGTGGAEPGGEFPAGVVSVGETRAYVTCQRDRELVEVDLGANKVAARIRVGGEPTKIIADARGEHLYVANANSDTVSVIDVRRRAVLGDIPTAAPDDPAYAALRTERGSNPNALALSPDEKTLYVTNGGNDTVAVIALTRDDDVGDAQGEVRALVPTGFYPNAITLSRDGKYAYVANGKSVTGPNPEGPYPNASPLQLSHGGLLAFPIPQREVLAKLTTQALQNNRVAPEATPAIFAALRAKVKHVIYVIAEGRSYDQILGDVKGADGAPSLLRGGEAITPNQHAIARGFVTLDRFFDSGSVSGDGWQWTVGGRTTDVAEKAIPITYAERGHHGDDWEGTNRNVDVGATHEERLAFNPRIPRRIDLLPGPRDVAAIDGPRDGGRGFLWDAAMAAGLTFRNYGCFVDDFRYALPRSDPARIPPIPLPIETDTRVAFPTRESLQKTTDPYYRGFDMGFADYWREKEWEREFDAYVANDALPSLETVRLPHDHLGEFETALDGLGSPEAQIADHDYAIGMLLEKVSHSRYWESTIVIVVEASAEDGADHVDAHRSLALFAGGHVKRGAIVKAAYTTVSVLKTIELLLNIPALGQKDEVARPMDDVLDVRADTTPFDAIVPEILRSTLLSLPP